MRTLSLLFTIVILLVSSLLLSTTSSSFVQAWWSQGHMLIAQIAKLNMDAKTIAIVDSHFEYLNKLGPFDKTTDMVTGASWADDIKGYGLEAPSPWHFTNTPLVLNGYNYSDINCPIQADNAASLLEGFIHGVTGRWEPHAPVNNGFTNAFATAFVVHLSGDLSQPLHNMDMFDADFPNGDRGGNEIKVQFPNRSDIPNLHDVWDSICGKYPNGDPRPLSPADRASLVAMAQQLNDTYQLTEEEASMTKGWDMHNEAYNIAKYVAYPHAFTYNETINQTYIDICIPYAERQIVRAGIRLARNLKFMFRTFTEVPNYLGELKARVNGNSSSTNDAADQWNSKATGALIGGIILGVALCLIGFVINKHRGNNKNGSDAGYASVQNNAYGSNSQSSMRTASAV